MIFFDWLRLLMCNRESKLLLQAVFDSLFLVFANMMYSLSAIMAPRQVCLLLFSIFSWNNIFCFSRCCTYFPSPTYYHLPTCHWQVRGKKVENSSDPAGARLVIFTALLGGGQCSAMHWSLILRAETKNLQTHIDWQIKLINPWKT